MFRMISLFELFSIGIGPSSSHTVGPMHAANRFCALLANQLKAVHRIQITLYGSLALTGVGHGTDKAVLTGLEGGHPETVDPAHVLAIVSTIKSQKTLHLNGETQIAFDYDRDLKLEQKTFLDKHPNALSFTAFDSQNQSIETATYYSIGGGFIIDDRETDQTSASQTVMPPFIFKNFHELQNHCLEQNVSIAELMLLNEQSHQDKSEIYDQLFTISAVMSDCIERGAHTEGTLPGGLDVKRRAPALYQKLKKREGIRSNCEDADVFNRLNVYAIAVNEENAAGGRVVTAPTNGAAGIIPAVLQYYKDHHPCAHDEGIIKFMLTAGAMGILYKTGASISGAEVGCQGEVGVAASMAAAGLTAALGGTLKQIENAAEIAMEHHLGMTCDPIKGLVQVPCIERNAMGAVKAVNASRLALLETGNDKKVSLDHVIATMLETGKDMMHKYKETAQGGLAVNVPEC
jgi:L-serine dehydratase